jgi:regulator of protease activity HflC (stomatin/prohibitin superfamily)
MNPITLFCTLVLAAVGAVLVEFVSIPLGVVFLVAAVLVALSLKVANTWQKFVVLRAGKLQGVKGPGLFLIMPVIDTVVAVIDERIQTTGFNAERALTRDTVPVNVDAIIFWRVHDARQAALEITDYRHGHRPRRPDLAARDDRRLDAGRPAVRPPGRRRAPARHHRAKTEAWGVTVLSVEIRDVAIPEALQDAMSRQAQAEREKQARVILGSAEVEVAAQFLKAAETYEGHPAALQLRAMNIIYETTKERGATILMPTAMVDAMNPAVAMALVAQKTDV